MVAISKQVVAIAASLAVVQAHPKGYATICHTVGKMTINHIVEAFSSAALTPLGL